MVWSWIGTPQNFMLNISEESFIIPLILLNLFSRLAYVYQWQLLHYGYHDIGVFMQFYFSNAVNRRLFQPVSFYKWIKHALYKWANRTRYNSIYYQLHPMSIYNIAILVSNISLFFEKILIFLIIELSECTRDIKIQIQVSNHALYNIYQHSLKVQIMINWKPLQI